MSSSPPRIIGRYALLAEIASGGMATVHVGRLLGPVGFSRTVAIKRLHPQFSKDPEFVAMFLDEARLAARIRHPNVVPTLDVVALAGELFLVLDYVQGEAFSLLLRESRKKRDVLPLPIVSAVVAGVLHGLHAAHEATNERGEPLGIVHRDVSPQNVLVGVDGVARVLDFGVAKAAGRLHTTREGQLKGKLPYMSPEQIQGVVTRSTDVYASAVVLWEALAGRRLFRGEEAQVLAGVLSGAVEPPSKYASHVPPELDAIVMRGLDRDPAARFETARAMARALERAVPPAPTADVGEWVEETAPQVLAERADLVARIEREVSAPGVDPRIYSSASSPRSAQMDSAPVVEAEVDTQLSSSSAGASRGVRPPVRRLLVAALVGTGVVALTAVVTMRITSASRAEDPNPADRAPHGVEPEPAPAAPPAPSVTPGEPAATAPTEVPVASASNKPASSAASRKPAPAKQGRVIYRTPD